MMLPCTRLLSSIWKKKQRLPRQQKKGFYAWRLIAICGFFLLVSATNPLKASENNKRRTLLNSLDPKSLSQHLAFYELYQDFPEGKTALSRLQNMLCPKEDTITPPGGLSLSSVLDIVQLLNQPGELFLPLQDHQLACIEHVSGRLKHHYLKGHCLQSEEEVMACASEEIDLARAVLLSQLGSSTSSLQQIRHYEAMLDMMALQIQMRLTDNPTPPSILAEINRLVFYDLGFRFPPHSLFAKEIDLYTFLPSVLDSRQGVCLGVSILYLCLAQRLGLALEILTPPGHIYIRYKKGEECCNVETTARGIDLPTDTYLPLGQKDLKVRQLKEVLGLAFINQAAAYSQKGEYAKAQACYARAHPYLPNDAFLLELHGLHCIMAGNEKEGRDLLLQAAKNPDPMQSIDYLADDYLQGFVDVEGIKAAFLPVDATTIDSLWAKKEALEKALLQHPRFRAGYFQLATTYLQLNRQKEALHYFEKLHEIDQGNILLEYYLAALYMERIYPQKAWQHMQKAQELSQDARPRALRELKMQLMRTYPCK